MSLDPLAAAIGMMARLEATQREYALAFRKSGQFARGETETAIADELGRAMGVMVERFNHSAPKANGKAARLVDVGAAKKNGPGEPTIVAARRVLGEEGKGEAR